MTDDEDQDLDRKLARLREILGFRFNDRTFTTGHLASQLKLDPSTMSRKRTGKQRVTHRDWCRLTEVFHLHRHGFTPDMFAAPFAAFDDHLRACGVGTYGGDDLDLARQILFEVAERGRDAQSMKIVIERTTRRRSGGIGADPGDHSVAPRFRVGEEVRVAVTTPGPGHVLLISDRDSKEMTRIAPSRFAPETYVDGRIARFPSDGSERSLPVGPPPDFYRLIAVWFGHKPTAAAAEASPDDDPRDLTSDEVVELAATVRNAEKAGRPVMVTMQDYLVSMD